MNVRVRFAPSPTGYLHVGNVRTALYNWLYARQHQGAFILRIEDTDVVRSDEHFEQQLMDDLRWLGLTWDEGPDCKGNHGFYRQSERLSQHREYATQLLKDNSAYYCFCSPEELESERQRQLVKGNAPRYSGKCRNIPPSDSLKRIHSGEEAVVRMKVREGSVEFEDLVFGLLGIQCKEIGDFILLRSDGTAAYNLACVVDDFSMEITHVIRGEGHISNTYRQILIYEALHMPMPLFAHLSTILSKEGGKLSKRQGATSINDFCKRGYLSESMVNYLALLGWAPSEEGREILGLDDLVAEFDLERVNRSPAVFDPEKLNWVNRNHLKRLGPDSVAGLAVPYWQQNGWIPEQISPQTQTWITEVVGAVLGYLDKVEDVVRESGLIFQYDASEFVKSQHQNFLLQEEIEVIEEFSRQLEDCGDIDVEIYREIVANVKRATGQKGRGLFHPIRLALTAQDSGPELDKLIPIFENGKRLDLPVPIFGVRERVAAFLQCLQ